MKRTATTLSRFTRCLQTAAAIALAVSAFAATAQAESPAAGKASLLYMLTDTDAKHSERLAKCDRLTIDEYKKHGVRVVEHTKADLAKWIEGDGKEHAKATEGFQQVAFARTLGVDAVGGLGAWNFTEEDAEGMPVGPKPGVFFHAWGMTLGGIYQNNMFDLDNGDKVQAIPLKLSPGSDDPWAITTGVTPQACSAADAMEPMEPMSSGRPFLGVGMDGNRVTNVSKNSPAKKAGLRTDDVFVSVDGKPIEDLMALVGILGDKKVGDTIELTYRREGNESTTEITLADRAAVAAINSPVGKPLPDLIGKDIHGKEIRLRDLRGKVVLLDFWATWCSPCVESAPMLQLLWERAKGDDFVWVGASVDDDEKAWKNFVKHNHLGGIQLLSPEWAEAMGVDGYPTVLLVDRSGMVQCNVHGEQIAQAALAMLKK